MRQQQNASGRQHGISLIMVLIFMVCLSLVTAVGMRQVMTGERVVANERDRSLAFQAAESAGREAVAAIDASTKAGGTALSGTGYFATPFSAGGNAEFWRTTTSTTAKITSCADDDVTKRFDWATCGKEASSNYGNTDKPQYTIEKMPDVVVSGSATEHWYRITSRATGGTKQADVILQLMYSY